MVVSHKNHIILKLSYNNRMVLFYRSQRHCLKTTKLDTDNFKEKSKPKSSTATSLFVCTLNHTHVHSILLLGLTHFSPPQVKSR